MATQTLTSSFTQENNTFNSSLDLAGRIGLAAIFLLAGINKVQYFEGNAQYMASVGLPEFLLYGAIIFEIVAALFIIVGFKTRLTSIAIAGFSVFTALVFHNKLGDQIQFIMFFKNIAIAGGFLILAANGAGKFSLDAKFK